MKINLKGIEIYFPSSFIVIKNHSPLLIRKGTYKDYIIYDLIKKEYIRLSSDDAIIFEGLAIFVYKKEVLKKKGKFVIKDNVLHIINEQI